jgi:hypothetical protein
MSVTTPYQPDRPRLYINRLKTATPEACASGVIKRKIENFVFHHPTLVGVVNPAAPNFPGFSGSPQARKAILGSPPI